MVTHYETLGISRSATQEEIATAFKELARKYHPDTLVSTGTKPECIDGRCRAPVACAGYGYCRSRNAESFPEISAAYAVLKDPAKRRRYDAELALLNKPCPVCAGKGQTYKSKGFTGRVATTCSSCNGSGIAATK